MITKDKLQPGMIFKFVTSPSNYKAITLIVESITTLGPVLRNYNLKFSHGVLELYEHFHKYNTPDEQVKKDLTRDGVK